VQKEKEVEEEEGRRWWWWRRYTERRELVAAEGRSLLRKLSPERGANLEESR